MISVKVLPKFKCDFCKKRSSKAAMEKHERRCYRNPNRFCDHCENLGFTSESLFDDDTGGGKIEQVPCEYCAKFNKETLAAIIKYEESTRASQEESIEELPF